MTTLFSVTIGGFFQSFRSGRSQTSLPWLPELHPRVVFSLSPDGSGMDPSGGSADGPGEARNPGERLHQDQLAADCFSGISTLSATGREAIRSRRAFLPKQGARKRHHRSMHSGLESRDHAPDNPLPCISRDHRLPRPSAGKTGEARKFVGASGLPGARLAGSCQTSESPANTAPGRTLTNPPTCRDIGMIYRCKTRLVNESRRHEAGDRP